MSTDAPKSTMHAEPPQATKKSSQGLRMAASAALLFVALLVALGVYAMVGPGPPVPRGVLTATAVDGGDKHYRQEGEVSEQPSITGTATKIDSQRSVSASTSTSSAGGARLFDNTLAIYNLDDDLLMQRIGLAVFEQLRDGGRFRQIRYVPAGKTLPPGDRVPDVFVTLDKVSWEESGWPGRKQFTGHFRVTASDQFRRSNHSYQSNLSPPRVQFRWQAEINYAAKQTGIESSGARYQAVGGDLGKEIAGKVTELLDSLATEHSRAGELPMHLYPEYKPLPTFGFLARLEAQKLVDGPAFMEHAVGVWQTPPTRLPQEVVATVRQSLTEDGWEVSGGDNDHHYLRATRELEVVTVFPEDDGLTIGGQDADAGARMFVVYMHSMPADEVQAAVERMFEEGAPESALLTFQNHWYQHRDLVEQYFEEYTPTQAESWLQLARLRKQSDPEAARNALLRANALLRVLRQESPDASMKKLAEELGLGQLPEHVSHEMIALLGLGELREPGEIQVTVRENEPAAVWLGEEDKAQLWLLLTPIRRPGSTPERTLRIQMLELSEGGWSRSEQTGGDLEEGGRPVHAQFVGGNQRVEVFSESAPDAGSYRLVLRRSAPNHTP